MAEYPFKDLLPLDEVLEREGYYNDWTHLDPEVFYSLTQISEYIKTKGYGVDVRLLISQLAEHFGLKTTQVVDLANLLQQKFDNLEGVTQSFTNNINSLVAQMEADKNAVIANATVDSEVILARGGEATLGNRLDDTTARLTQTELELNRRGISVESYGATGDYVTDDGVAIQETIDYVSSIGGGTVLLLPNHLINTPIKVPSNIHLKSAMSTKIKSTTIKGLSAVFSINKESDNVSIQGITFDFESLNSCVAIQVNENVTNLYIDNLKFKNFYADDTVYQALLRLKTGLHGTISNLSFKNIKCVGNGVIADSGGAGRCIITDSYGVTDLRNYNLNIDKVVIDDCFNVDSNGSFIIEDFDPFHFQHVGVTGTINVTNVVATNFSKRLIKIQAPGVNISNVIAETDFDTPWLIAVMDNDVSISNVFAKGNIDKVIIFIDTENVNASNININSSYVGTNVTNSAFSFYNSSNINISNVSGESYGGFMFYGKVTENINISQATLKLRGHILYVESRDSDNSDYTGGRIRNISFSDIAIEVASTTHNGPLFSVGSLTDPDRDNPITQLSFRNVKLTTNQLYKYSLIRVLNASNVMFDNFNIRNTSSHENPSLVTLETGSEVQIRGLYVDSVPTLNEIVVTSTARLLITRGEIKNIKLSGAECHVELEKTPAVPVFTSSATEGQLTIS